MDWFYARVSTEQQNVDRQLKAAADAGIAEKNIFIDKESGKDFNRTNWKKLTRKMKQGDVLFVKSLDRLGRNYKDVLKVWSELTKDRCVDVVVLDMPLLDTRREKNLLGTFIADLVLQILAFVAENERANIRQRQLEGIRAAHERGVVFGRKKKPLPENFEQVARQWLTSEITIAKASELTGLAVTTFRVNAMKFGTKSRKHAQTPKRLPDNFDEAALLWFAGKITTTDAVSRYSLGMHPSTFAYKAKARFPDMEPDVRKLMDLGRMKGHETLRARRENDGDEIRRQLDQRRRKLNALHALKVPKNFDEQARYYLDGQISLEHAALYTCMSQKKFLLAFNIWNGKREK